ncbi:MAG: SLC13 family permease, partial [Rhodospirillales bacterium]|nr:SLC13 family permease [Rhodospirillales bacterium]
RFAEKLAGNRPWTTICALLVFIACLSGFINNTPLVIIFIPILQAVAGRLRLAPGSVMMPLSFATILGGMTTLIGSSTNLLVSSSLISLGRPGLGLFEVSPVGVPVAAAGLLYIFFFARRLLGGGTLLTEVTAGEGKQFIAQLTISPQSKLIGQTTVAGMLRGLTDVVIKVLERDGQSYTPPLIEDMPIAAGDILVVAASRRSLSEALARNPGLTVGEVPGQNGQGRSGPQVMVEAMVVPTSPMIGHSLEQLEFTHHTQCAVVGLRRRAQLIRQRMTEIKLQAGDVLLVQGTESAVRALRQRHEVVVLEGTAADLREPHHGTRAVLIFAAVIVLAASGILPIVLAAILGAALMVLSGTLSLRQASRAVSRRIVMLVGSSLALGEAMEATGAAAYL